MRLLAPLFALLLSAAPVAADNALHALVTGDEGRGWGAVGRVDLGGAAFCTGALIAPDLVLTAAHCLFSAQTGALIATDQISFRAGWRNGSAVAYRGVRRAVMPAGYRFDDADKVERIAEDIALLELDQRRSGCPRCSPSRSLRCRVRAPRWAWFPMRATGPKRPACNRSAR